MLRRLLMKLVIFLSVCVVAPNASCQSAGSSENRAVIEKIKDLAASGISEDQAKAIFLVGKYRMKEAAPIVMDIISRNLAIKKEKGKINRQTKYVYLSAMDALIQMEEDVPIKTLLMLPTDMQEHIVIIAARNAKKYREVLLYLVGNRRTWKSCWVAACNVLLRNKEKCFASCILRGMEIESRIVVRDEDGKESKEGYNGIVDMFDGRFTVPEGFPPIGMYVLVQGKRMGAKAFAPGDYCVSYERIVVKPGKGRMFGGEDGYPEKNELRLYYLEKLLGRGKLLLKHVEESVVFWKSEKVFRCEVENAKEKIKRKVNELIKQLVKQEIITDSESEKVRVKIKTSICDRRNDKKEKLPRLTQ
jgi:hypothetical protein